MKKLLLILLLVVPFIAGIAQNLVPPPNPPRLVNDYAGVLSKEQVSILEEKLVALDDSTSNQIAVVILKSLEGYEVQEYANKLFRSWGIGNKKTNNGVLILASIEDRKIWIEVGYGLEGAIPDVIASSIYRNEIVPEFKQQNYYRGIDNAINALAKAAVGEYKTKRVKKNNKSGDEGSSILTFIFIIIVIIFILGAGRGGGRGGRGGGMMSRRGAANVAEALLWSSLLGGNNRGGGGFGGGGFGGGGFGGFGGGSSGGGGAGGSW